jgi:GT2 family glycosyltransferase
VDNSENDYTPCAAYQHLLEKNEADIIIYFHDDVTVHDADWLERTLEPFEDPDVVAVGYGGAVGLGNRDLYRKPYRIQNMARIGYQSNQTDWQTHGGHLIEPSYVAVLDAFCMAVRRDWLVRRGCWPMKNLTHHCLDLWLACEAARDRKRIVAVPVSVTHHGGGSSIKPVYAEAAWLQGGTLASDHQRPHDWLWNEYRDVLPLEVR